MAVQCSECRAAVSCTFACCGSSRGKRHRWPHRIYLYSPVHFRPPSERTYNSRSRNSFSCGSRLSVPTRLLLLRPSCSVAKLSTPRVICARVKKYSIIAVHITAFVPCRCPSFAAPFFSAAASSASPYMTWNRLLPRTSSYAVIAISAFHFGTCAFPIAEATKLQTHGVATFMNSAV